MEKNIRTYSLKKENESLASLAYPLIIMKKSFAIHSINSAIAYFLNKYLNEFQDKKIYFVTNNPDRNEIILMRKLSRIRCKVHLINEKDLISQIDAWEVLCSGAEFICKSGVGNSPGTNAIAKLCKRRKKSYYIFAGSNIFIMNRVKPSASQCIIPFRNVTYIITERRLYTAQDIIAYFSGTPHGFCESS